MGSTAMLVIGAGLSRTGTLSTKAALEQLLCGPCYHGSTPLVERPDHAHLWMYALDTGTLNINWAKQKLIGYKSGVDFPMAGWYKKFMVAYPDARVILTVRDPKKWYKSDCFIMHILSTLAFNWPYSWFFSFSGSQFIREYVQKACGGFYDGKGKLPPGINGKMNEALNKGEQAAVKFFKEHIAEVCFQVPADKLLVFDVKEGWEPLCKFLDVPVPDTPFPNINNSTEVRRVFNTMKAVAWLAILGVLGLIFYTLFFSPDLSYVPIVMGIMCCLLWGASRIMQVAVVRQTDKSKH